MPVLGPVGETSTDLTDRLKEIEDASAGKLPSRISLGLAQSDLQQIDLRKAAAIAARRFDIPPDWLLKPVGLDTNGLQLYRDPITGGAITLSTARLLIAPYEARIVRQMV